MANPFDQFDASAQAGAAANPFDQFDAASKPSGGTAPPLAANPITDTALAALGHLGMGLPEKLGLVPDQVAKDVAQAHQNLGWADVPLGMATYMLGPGKLLGPAGKMIGGTGLGGLAAEGGLAGAVSDFDPNAPISSTLRGGAIGTGLGTAGGLIGKGVEKAFSKPGTVDPAAAIAQTTQQSAAAYNAMRQIPIAPLNVEQPIGGVMGSLDPSMQTGMSSGFQGQVNQIRNALQMQHALGNSVDGSMVDSWQRQINSAASNSIDGQVAHQIDGALDGVLQAHGAGGLQDAAQAAFKQKAMAENLAEWQRKTAAGADIGQAPLTEAERFYQGTPEYQPLADLYSKSQKGSPMSYVLGHMAANAAGAVGGMIGGWPTSFIGEGLGYLFAKPAIASALKGQDTARKIRMIQQLYPQYTGIQPTGGSQVSPGMGDAITKLMLGAVY